MDISTLPRLWRRDDNDTATNGTQNGTDSNANSNNNNDNLAEIVIASVALVISLIALVASLLQVAQQYFASAAGYSNCNAKVMGKWHRSKKRLLRAAEFRFEVQFDAPVIFLCPPTNRNGPVKTDKIRFLDGTPASLEDTWSDLDPDKKPPSEDEKKMEKDQIHTADNERATWVTLMSALQRMEHDSRQWQRDMHDRGPAVPPRRADSTATAAVLTTTATGATAGTAGTTTAHDATAAVLRRVEASYTLTAAVQRKKRSWDTMPAGVRRPYATTTMCHMVEMAAILGVYWSEFDRTHDRYRAEGNGFIITGEKVPDLGIMFSFQVYGKNRFEENRIIPIDEVKELCFGFVPTLYRETSDNRRLAYPNDEPRDLSALQLSSRPEIAETLVLIGCNTNTVNYFTQEQRRDSHLFPIAFEILGMIGRNLHIQDSCFRLLPNPTLYRWDRKNFSLPKMLTSYQSLVDEPRVLQNPNSVVLTRIKAHIRKLQIQLDDNAQQQTASALGHSAAAWPGLALLRALHEALDDLDEVLTAKRKPPPVTAPAPAAAAASERVGTNRLLHERQGSQNKLLDAVLLHHEKTTPVTATAAPVAVAEKTKEPAEKPREKERRQLVQDVLRSHLQEVLLMMNDRDESSPAAPAAVAEPPSATATTFPVLGLGRAPRFEDIDAAAPEDKQAKFMEVYFKVVRDRVVAQSSSSTQRRLSVAPGVGAGPPPFIPVAVRRQGTSTTHASITERADEDDALTMSPGGGGHGKRSPVEEEEEDDDDEEAVAPTPEPEPEVALWELEAVSHEDIWCTLVFRMMCWLMMHDFHKKDVQISKSELLGSRLPVYIA